MEFLGDDLIAVLTFLLPGFLAAWVFHGLTPFPKPPQLERVIQALILTMFVQVGVNTVAWGTTLVGDWRSLGGWTEGVRLGWSLAFALLLGLFLARWASHDTLHSRLREWDFTSLTSYPSEWFSEFARSQCYVVLHLKGERRLYGWPEQWPSTPHEGHFSMAEAEWLEGSQRTPLVGVRNILIPVEEVDMVEFMEMPVQGAESLDGHQEAHTTSVQAESAATSKEERRSHAQAGSTDKATTATTTTPET